MRRLAVLGLLLAIGAGPAAPKRILFFTKSSGFEHSVIKKILEGGIRWALGEAEAEVSPNVAKAAPGY
jgi:hypothetical protein